MYDEAYDQFLDFYKKHVFKKTLKRQVLWYLGWTQYLKGNYKGSIKYFDELLSFFKKRPLDYETSIEKLSYWKAMALSQLKEYDKAQKVFMKISQNGLLTYYSFLSYYRLREISSKSSIKMAFIRGASVSDFLDYQDKVKKTVRMPASLRRRRYGL